MDSLRHHSGDIHSLRDASQLELRWPTLLPDCLDDQSLDFGTLQMRDGRQRFRLVFQLLDYFPGDLRDLLLLGLGERQRLSLGGNVSATCHLVRAQAKLYSKLRLGDERHRL